MHQPLGGVHGQAADIVIAAKAIEKTREELSSIIAYHCGQEREKVYTDMDRDFWMVAEGAVSYGMVDHILRKESSTRNS